MTDKRLFKATVSFEIVVLADDALDAFDAVKLYASEELDNVIHGSSGDAIREIEPIERTADIPSEWLGAIPWGADSDDTVPSYLP